MAAHHPDVEVHVVLDNLNIHNGSPSTTRTPVNVGEQDDMSYSYSGQRLSSDHVHWQDILQ